MRTLKFTAVALLLACLSALAFESATEYLTDRLQLRNNGTVQYNEATPNGTSYLRVKGPAALAANVNYSQFDPSSITIADVVGAGEAAYTISTPTKADYFFTCSDTSGGCGVYLSDTGAYNGAMLRIVNVGGSNNVTMREVDGVSETSGTLTISQDMDAVEFLYVVDRWVQLTAVENN